MRSRNYRVKRRTHCRNSSYGTSSRFWTRMRKLTQRITPARHLHLTHTPATPRTNTQTTSLRTPGDAARRAEATRTPLTSNPPPMEPLRSSRSPVTASADPNKRILTLLAKRTMTARTIKSPKVKSPP